MMQGVNLIPIGRRIATARAARRRIWLTAGAAYAVALTAFTLLLRTLSAGSQANTVAQIQARTEEIALGKSALAAERKTLKALLTEAETVEVIYWQPDWSILLDLIAQAGAGDIVLRSLRITPVVAGDAAARPESPQQYVVTLSGLGQLQSAVSACVLRLERSGVLHNVKLVQSRREPFLEGDAVAFEIECVLAGRSNDTAIAGSPTP